MRSLESALIEVTRLNTALAQTVISRFPAMMNSAAGLLRAAAGAGLVERPPQPGPAEEPQGAPARADSRPAAGAGGRNLAPLIAQVLPVLIAALQAQAAAPAAERPDAAVQGMASFEAAVSPLTSAEQALARAFLAELDDEPRAAWLEDLAALPRTEAIASVRALLHGAEPGGPAAQKPTAAPTSIAPEPPLRRFAPSVPLAPSSPLAPSHPSESIPPPLSQTQTLAPAPAFSQPPLYAGHGPSIASAAPFHRTDAARNAAALPSRPVIHPPQSSTVPPSHLEILGPPSDFGRMVAILDALEPAERALALVFMEELDPLDRRGWMRELTQQPHAAAVAQLRALLAPGGEGRALERGETTHAARDEAGRPASSPEVGLLQACFDRARFLAMLVRLSPAERALAQGTAAELPIGPRRAWLRHLASLPNASAAASVRSLAARPSPRGSDRQPATG